MPTSTNYFKKETKDFIINNFDKDCKILDVGAGVGTYYNLLKNYGFHNIDCVEVFSDYIRNYNLEKKYKKVFNEDITKLNIDFDEYDLIIFGDVLEHIERYDAQKILNKIKKSCVIVSVPFESPQGEHFGNVYEIHLQDDITLENFFQNYDGFYPLYLRFDYGVFVNKQVKEIFIETEERSLPNHFENVLQKNFSELSITNVNPELTTMTKSNLTIVTALWDLGRGNINDGFKRKYEDYLEKFSLLLKSDVNMYIFCDPQDENFIWKYRKKENTVINKMTLDELKTWFNFTETTNKIRQDENWLSQSSWLKDSPQATLDAYNPLVMSKMFMLNNVTIWNPFDSDYFFWIDAGICNTVHYGYFTHDKVFDNLPDFIDTNQDFVFITYPYEGGNEIHGFERNSIARYCGTDYVDYVCRGGFFGGKKNRINEINGLYYSYLNSSLSEGLMGTEESIFTIVLHNHRNLVTKYNIKNDGLIWPFFEDLKNKEYEKNVELIKTKNITLKNVGLYVITFNSPNQFRTLINSIISYDNDFLIKTQKFLLDNSTDLSITLEYKKLCEQYGFEHIKKDNLGICGGRQWIAEHAEENELDGYWFSEDDMFFQSNQGVVCRNGFPRYTPNLYHKCLEIVKKENFDFLKLNFSEFYGDNSTQWSWYNVPQDVREKRWPEKSKLPVMGLDPNAPKTKFDEIKSYDGLPYATGEIYYCNWTHFVTREGNRKMFLTTKWAHPFENTWMSYMYQETLKGNLKPGILLMTPIEHNRFEHYEGSLRKES